MKKGFTLLEVLVAVVIVGFAFGTFIAFAGKIVDTTDLLFKTTLSSVVAHNSINEILYGGKSFNDRKVDILNCTVEVNQDFEELMGFRVTKVEAGTEDRGKLAEVYEVR
jgi:prepilin-type N-terminal cleavage/methylation domain-containing protein